MTSPAQVSGPGALSRRTDAGGQPIRDLPDPKYGEATEYRDVQKAAPLAKAPGAPVGPTPTEMTRKLVAEPGPAPAPDPRPLPGLFDRGDPSVPVTTGASLGPGRNEVVGGAMPMPQRRVSEQLAEYANGDEGLTALVHMLSRMGQ
jgi:hypothetical protein